VTGSLVSPATRQRVRDLATPIATALGRLGLTPNALTLIGFAGTCVGAVAAANQWWFSAGVLVLAFGIFDLFDGTLARATGQATKLGAFLDSTFDRAGESIVYIGVAIGLLASGFREGAILATAAMGAAFMVSYTRAKSESLGFTPGNGMASVGLMPREVRLVILSLGLILAPEPIYAVPPPGAACAGVCDFPQGGTVTLALFLIAAGSVITTIQRILHVRAQAREG
jgi:CDP-diacylglycerol---glycerol-3-phosphate 3-phosphatidyltransferase